ncbi:MAG: TetR/AcrR family transcriptional regulator [Lachnospiraceae bacterium]|nr:TetR/AcrR family transcriptional regulator [Lachnospiraceae bacterium]
MVPIPKIIENVREDILKTSRELLVSEGYKALTIRRVAGICGIASGTVYNYFPSKEDLAAAIMLEDWQREMGIAADACRTAQDPMDGLETLFDTIHGYGALYAAAWSQYGGAASVPAQYHRLLIGQLCGMIGPMLERRGVPDAPALAGFFAETLLHFSLRSESSFADIRPFLQKLMGE